MKKNLLLALLIICFAACSGRGKKDAEIIIFTTNDMHGRIDNFPKVSAYLKKAKAEHKHVFLFNAGDMFSGNPLIDQYPEKGYPIIDIMNRVGYQLGTFGNHEFDYGQDMLASRLKDADFPFLLANAEITEPALSQLPEFKPYMTFDVGGIKMTVISAVEVGSGGTPSTHPDRVKGISFYDPVEKLQEYKCLRKDCNVFIGLTHIGIEQDIRLAEAMPELDVILGGHSHTRIDTGMIVNSVLITQSESWLKYLGQTTIIVKNGKVISKSNKLIDLSKVTDTDPSIQKLIDKYKTNDPGSVVIGQLTNAIKGKEALGSFMTDALTEGLGLDIAMQNAGGVRVPKIEAGDITINDVYSLDPFGNEVIKINMTGAEIKALIESTLRRTRGNSSPDLLISGMLYTATVKRGSGETLSIDLKDKNGKPLDMKRTYAVGMNSYIYTKYQFEHADPGVSLKITSANALIDYIKQNKAIKSYANENRIKIEQVGTGSTK
ncbi:MAG: bifunctional metallophosphatase/5'-nucleotidase [Prevotellaceae bacterium]|jgi:2',3'-cyclic-nucleotide 2'-phosphodiesterase (5'-nucleotidase family)|nr:bifunctional metallophosphatase/5'-nucleotidase [Prevotellaceae bacterium]